MSRFHSSLLLLFKNLRIEDYLYFEMQFSTLSHILTLAVPTHSTYLSDFDLVSAWVPSIPKQILVGISLNHFVGKSKRDILDTITLPNTYYLFHHPFVPIIAEVDNTGIQGYSFSDSIITLAR